MSERPVYTWKTKKTPCWAEPRASGQLDTRLDPTRATLQRQIVALALARLEPQNSVVPVQHQGQHLLELPQALLLDQSLDVQVNAALVDDGNVCDVPRSSVPRSWPPRKHTSSMVSQSGAKAQSMPVAVTGGRFSISPHRENALPFHSLGR